MGHDDLQPDHGPPPRHVEPWTRVPGHVAVRRASRPFCSCGWSGNRGAAQAAIDDHLRDAWPILVPRDDGESHEAWRQRVAIAHNEALDELERLWAQDRMDDPTLPGHEFPLISEELSRADDRVRVLKHQLDA